MVNKSIQLFLKTHLIQRDSFELCQNDFKVYRHNLYKQWNPKFGSSSKLYRLKCLDAEWRNAPNFLKPHHPTSKVNEPQTFFYLLTPIDSWALQSPFLNEKRTIQINDGSKYWESKWAINLPQKFNSFVWENPWIIGFTIMVKMELQSK